MVIQNVTAPEAVSLTIDGRSVEVPKNTLLWEAARTAGIDIPIFCYHSKLGPVGVCRMCMVEIEGQPKLTTACTTGAADGMVVHTRSPEVEKAQRGVLEFLLINHPLDCPICDRGGECPLQDQTFTYGPGVSRFIERKRHFLKPIHLGPTIDLDRERCILCWRCVRYTSEVAGDDQLVLVDRGSETYIGTYEGLPYESNFTGNVIELCPVGALTSRKQRFMFRPWELKQHASVCPHCPMGCNIHIDVRDAQEVIRFRSRTNDAIDDGWLCDRGRFGFDFIGTPERLKTPLVRRDGRLTPTSWQAAYRVVAENLLRVTAEKGGDAVAGVVSARLPNEDLFVFKRFMTEVVGSTAVDYWPRPEQPLGPADLETLAALDRHMTSIDALDRATVVLIVGTDPSEREPVMELRIRKAVNKLGARLVEVGTRDIPLTSNATSSLRCNGDQIAGILRALGMPDVSPPEWPQFGAARDLITKAGSVVVLYEPAMPDVYAAGRADVLNALSALVERLSRSSTVGLIPMLLTCNEMAARDFALLATGSAESAESVVSCAVRGNFAGLVLAGANPAKQLPDFPQVMRTLDFSVVSDLVLSPTAAAADVVLPAASFAERVGTFTNTVRRVQMLSAAVPAPGIARPDWQILVELSQRWDRPLTYSSPEAILTDIAQSVPLYRERLPRSYGELSPAGLPLAGEVVAAQ
jgi:NADH-quinone oxidoreductase subunit G